MQVYRCQLLTKHHCWAKKHCWEKKTVEHKNTGKTWRKMHSDRVVKKLFKTIICYRSNIFLESPLILEGKSPESATPTDMMQTSPRKPPPKGETPTDIKQTSLRDAVRSILPFCHGSVWVHWKVNPTVLNSFCYFFLEKLTFFKKNIKPDPPKKTAVFDALAEKLLY